MAQARGPRRLRDGATRHALYAFVSRLLIRRKSECWEGAGGAYVTYSKVADSQLA